MRKLPARPDPSVVVPGLPPRCVRLGGRAFSILLVAVAATSGVLAQAAQLPMFKIERNKNANIVQYDLVLGEDGTFRQKNPVIAYWVRLAHDGEIRELTRIQKQFAYGFKAKVNQSEDTVTLNMVADIGRPIMIGRASDQYKAWMRIGEEDCFIDRLFIHSTGSGMSTKVDFIEMHGIGKATATVCYEKLTP